MHRKLRAIGRWFCRFPVVPEIVVLLVMAAFVSLIWSNRLPYPFRWQVEKILLAATWFSAAGIIWLIVCGVSRWRQKERERGGALLLFAFGSVLATAGCLGAYYFYFYFGPTRDHFADHLHLPTGVVLQTAAFPETDCDFRQAKSTTFQAKVLNSFPSPLGNAEKELALPSLEKMQETDAKKASLLQYLAIHPEWRLYRESVSGNYIATRRFFGSSGNLVTTRDGSYRFSGSNGSYRYRLDLRLSGRSWNNRTISSGSEHDSATVYHRYTTRVKAGTACVEIIDESTEPGRKMTLRTLSLLETEFAALLSGTSPLQEDAVQKGKPSITLSGNRGDYVATIRCNPGEPGDIYLKAYEITGNTPLSADYLRRTATERTGYSNAPDELYFAQVPFRIYEGDWGQFYGANIQVWFVPEDKTHPERMICSENFKIEGWMREE